MDPRSEFNQLTEVQSEKTRALTAENPEGEVGAGGQAVSNLGPGRKGSPFTSLPEGEETKLGDVDGPGEIRHIWITVPEAVNHVFRDLVLRMYWDGEDEPSVEVPLGDFFCNGHGMRYDVTSAPIVVAPSGGLNCYFPMPFRENARITVENRCDQEISLFFYQIDYAIDTIISEDTAYFHAQWRRTNPTSLGEDHVIVDNVKGEGHFVGTNLAWTALSDNWWGEGEVKCFIDGDEEYPTICGTGAEDYVGGAWGFGDDETYSTPYLGYPLCDDTGAVTRHGLYRWHLPDPIRFTENFRASIQAIGHDGQLFERSDDVASTAYWYQKEPHNPFPKFPDDRARRPR